MVHVGFLIVQNRVAVEEGAAAAVLTDQTQFVAFVEQGGVRQIFCKAPVARQLAGGHLASVFVDLGDARVQAGVVGKCVDQRCKLIELFALHPGVDRVGQFAFQQRTPIDCEFVRLHLRKFGADHASVELVAVSVDQRLRLVGLQRAGGGEPLCIQLAGGLALADILVHQRLRRRRFIGFVMAVAAVADQINDHVFRELLPEIEREFGAECDRFRIVAVHVQHRRADHLGDIGAIQRGACVLAFAGGETHLVIDDDMQRAADREPAGLRHLEQFHHHALAGECGVAVHDDRQYLLARPVAATVLARTYAAHHHRIDDFKMRRVERQR